MGNFQQKHVFLKGMNLDADPRFIEEGDYGDAWNIIINNKIGGSAGTVENIKGNVSHDYDVFTSLNGYVPSNYALLLTSGSNSFRYTSPYNNYIVSWQDDKCIGWCEDTQNNALFFFVCRQASNASTGGWVSKYPSHYCPRVFRYDTESGVLRLIYDRISLSFNPLLPIQAKFINNSLYFCNGVEWNSSELKHINLNISNTLPEIEGGYENDVDISWAKCPPKSPPVWVLQNNPSRSAFVNNLKGKTFQFSSRFIYYSGEKSVWSSFSVGCPVYPKDQYNDLVPTDYNQIIIGNDNYGISTNFSTYGKIISYVEYAFRETSYSQWKLIKRTPYQSNITIINYTNPSNPYNSILVDGINHTNLILFFNDESYTVIPDEEIIKPFDTIPQKSKTLESVQGRVHIADNIEDFPTFTDTLFNNTAYNLLLNQNEAVAPLDALLGTEFTKGDQDTLVNTRVLKTNSKYTVAIEFLDRASRKTFTYTSEKMNLNTLKQQGVLVKTDKYSGLSINGNNFPPWVKKQFTHFSILLTENNDVSFYIQCAIEHAYYVTGRDINNSPKFTKRIGDQYDLNITPSASYIKTIEAANQYQLSQVYLDRFNYTVNRNSSADYSQATETWIDISNLTKYSNNVPYIYNQGDRVRLLTLGIGIGTASDAAKEFDYPIKEQNGRFIVIDSETSEFSGIDSVDYGVGNVRLSVAVNDKGDIYYSTPTTGYGFYYKATNVGFKLNKVSIQRVGVNPYVVAVGDNGKFFISRYTSIATWNDAPNSTSFLNNILNINYAQVVLGQVQDTSDNFFFVGANGLVGRVVPTSLTTINTFVMNPSGTTYTIPYNISTWDIRGIDVVHTSTVTYGVRYCLSIAAYTQVNPSYGACAVIEVLDTTFTYDRVVVTQPVFIEGAAPNYNDCVCFIEPNDLDTFVVVLGGAGSGGAGSQGQINCMEYKRGIHTLDWKGSMLLGDSRFGEITSMCRATTYSSIGLPFRYYFYATDINGQILARGFYIFSAKYYSIYSMSKKTKTDGGFTRYTDEVIYGFPKDQIKTRFPNLPDCILNQNVDQTAWTADPCQDIDPFPFSPVSIMPGNTYLKDITISAQNEGVPYVSNYIDGTIRVAGRLFGNGLTFDYGNGGSVKLEARVDAFISTDKKPILNYGALIEIYRPKAKKSQTYYESILGSSFYDSTNKYYQSNKKRVYPILTNLIDDISKYTTTSTTLLGDEGDSFCLEKDFKGRLWSKKYKIISMTPDASNITGNHIDSQDVDTPFGWQKTNGKPNIKATNTEAISFKKTGHRFSLPFLPNSKINGLSTFESDNEKIFPQEYIECNKLVVASDNKINGSILLSLFTSNSISIYISKNQLTDGSGDRQVGLSDQVLGSFNTLEGGYGCTHPESVGRFNQKVWWWDASKGVIVRYSRDGITPLSDVYKVRSYIRPKATLFQSQYKNPAYSQLAVGTYDFYNDLYLLCLREIKSGLYKGETIVFEEELNTFMSKHDISNSTGITPELMANLNNQTFSFLNGLLYIHNIGEYNTFYGHKKNSTIEIITNKSPSDVKEFVNISLESADKWSVEKQITSIYNRKIKQLSGLELTDYTTEEGIYRSDLRRDINTVDKFTTKTGTITTSTTTGTVTGIGTLFTTELMVGYAIFSNNTLIGIVKTITSNTSLDLEEKANTNVSSNPFMTPPIGAGYTVSESINTGDKLRGNYMITKLKLDPSITNKSQIFAVNIEFNTSNPLNSK